MIEAAIFDLDGVVVDTARFHYQAWKRLADELSIPFSPKDNERLKGVSRTTSLEIILSLSKKSLELNNAEKEALAARKNAWYVENIQTLQPSDMLPGVLDFLHECRRSGIKTAIASASKNTPTIIAALNAEALFDSIVDGNRIVKAKPNPEVFLQAASDLQRKPEDCVVFEDAEAGVEGAIAAGMKCIGIGDKANLARAHMVIPGFKNFRLTDLEKI